MKVIDYKIEYEDGSEEIVRVKARSINTGAKRALGLADPRKGFHSLQFWMVKS